jgi:hypothetical protein
VSTFDKIDRLARSQIGYHEGRSNGHWNNNQKYSKELPGFAWSNYQAWCATFVCWVFWKVGHYDLLETPSAGVDQLSVGFKRAGRWSEYPAKGAVVFYGVPHDLSHTGICVDYDDDWIYVVEGNTNGNGSREGDGVYLKKRFRRDSYVVGYGYPKFPEGIESADPRFKGEKPNGEHKDEPKHKGPRKRKPAVSLRRIQRVASRRAWARAFGPVDRKHEQRVIEALEAAGFETYADWQRSLGYRGADADGVPGNESLRALARKTGKFRVVR